MKGNPISNKQHNEKSTSRAGEQSRTNRISRRGTEMSTLPFPTVEVLREGVRRCKRIPFLNACLCACGRELHAGRGMLVEGRGQVARLVRRASQDGTLVIELCSRCLDSLSQFTRRQ